MPTFSRADLLDVVVFADPAGPKRQQTAELKRVKARMASVAVGLTPLGHYIVLDTWAKRATTIDFIEAIYHQWQRWHPSRIGIEEVAQQGLFIDAFDYLTRVTKGQKLPIVGVPVPKNQDKNYRIRTTLQPIINEGRLVVADNHLELLSEIRSFPRSALRDLIDALTYAVQLLPAFRGGRRRSESELDHYLAYLRAANAPVDAIKRAEAQCVSDTDKRRERWPASRRIVATSHQER